MKQFQLLFEDLNGAEEKLLNLKKECDSFEHGAMTFYITWMNDVQENADAIQAVCEKIFPDAICYGNESSGNINNGRIKYGVNVTCYVFENKSTKTELVWIEQGTKIQNLEDLWEYCRTKKDLAAVELASSIASLVTLGIEGNIPNLDERVHVFGGVSCNYFNPEKFSGILATGHPRTETGIAAILYTGDNISFHTTTVLGWKSLGKKMKVTASHDNVISEIDNTPAFEMYEHYLGLNTDDNDSLVFPLMVTEGIHDFIRTPRIINPDKSIEMFFNIPIGTACSIAYGDKNTILASITEKANIISQWCPQAIKVFSCGGRRLFWGDEEISNETEILQKIVPVSGFYTGGEIMKIEGKVRVLNQTLAITTISEDRGAMLDAPIVLDEIDKSLVARLAHFTDVVSREQDEEQRKLKQDMEIISGLASQYTTLFLTNLDNETFVNYSYSEKDSTNLAMNARTIHELRDAVLTTDFVHPDSKEDFYGFFNNEKDKLRNSKTASLLFKRKYGDEYLWTKALAVKCEPLDEEAHHAVLGFVECDDEVRRDETIHKFTDVLERGQDPEVSIDNILSALAEYYKSDRAYVMEFYNNGKNIRNTYGWLKEGVTPISDIHYDGDDKQIEQWYDQLNKNCCIFYEAGNSSYEKAKEFLLNNQIFSSISVAMKQNDVILGFVAVDNPRKSSDDAGVAKIASAVINSEIMRRKENDEEHITLGKLSDSFVSVYYANLDSDYIHAWKIADGHEISTAETGKYSDVVSGYINAFAQPEDKEKLMQLLNTEYVAGQLQKNELFAVEVTTFLWGKDRNLVFDFIRVTDDGKQFVISCRDVTEITERQREHQRQLQEALEMAKSADKAKTEFLFNMSHDIRTPMNAILGFTDMAIRHFDDEERAMDSLTKIKSSGGHLLNLINDILEMSRIESGKFELGESPIDIREAIDNVANMTQSLATPKSIDYQVIKGEFKNPYIYADELHINEVIVNLISNSIKYTNEDGKVRYTIDQISDVEDGKVWYRFDITDNGIGMSEEFQKHLFEAFSREKSSTVSKIQGAGLGLSIVKRIVDLAGGKIVVNSKLGVGSSFIVDLPFRVMDQEAIDKLIPEKKQKNDANIKEDIVLEGRRVLLVEDNEMNREIADEILTEAGLVIETAENGQIAVDMVSDKGMKYYDFILMDIQMPVLDGYGATAAIRNLPDGDKITIIALSANAFDEDKQKSISMGMNAHVAKPIDVNELFDVMHNLA